MGSASRAALAGWILVAFAYEPFFTLVTTFVFAPYVASALAPNPVTGQALWGYATAAAGLALAATSPVLGSVADARGPKKVWIGGSALVLAAACLLLWFAAPGSPGALPIALGGFMVGTVAAEVLIVFNNALMPHLVSPLRLGRLSGTGWAAGYAGGLLALVVVLGFMAASPETGLTYFGVKPLFGLDPGLREGDRASGPLSAIWLLVFIVPLFLLTPDAPRAGEPARGAIRAGLARLGATVADARRDGTVARFLLANMIYQDGLVALFAFGGIYGAGVFGWGPTQLGIFGILAAAAGLLGALVGGRLDDRFGAKAVILGCLGVLVLVSLGILSLGRNRILFVVAVDPPAPGLFSGLPERIFLGLGIALGTVAAPLQAASRSFLARLVPPGEAGRYFGLLALSGRVTSFLAPLLVAIATEASGTQTAGPAILIAFFLAGAALMSGVRPRRMTGGSPLVIHPPTSSRE